MPDKDFTEGAEPQNPEESKQVFFGRPASMSDKNIEEFAESFVDWIEANKRRHNQE